MPACPDVHAPPRTCPALRSGAGGRRLLWAGHCSRASRRGWVATQTLIALPGLPALRDLHTGWQSILPILHWCKLTMLYPKSITLGPVRIACRRAPSLSPATVTSLSNAGAAEVWLCARGWRPEAPPDYGPGGTACSNGRDDGGDGGKSSTSSPGGGSEAHVHVMRAPNVRELHSDGGWGGVGLRCNICVCPAGCSGAALLPRQPACTLSDIVAPLHAHKCVRVCEPGGRAAHPRCRRRHLLHGCAAQRAPQTHITRCVQYAMGRTACAPCTAHGRVSFHCSSFRRVPAGGSR